MTKAEQSTQLFNQAVEMKRQGRFAEAIRLQQESIRVYPEDPELPNNYYSMGKIFYLMNEFDACYSCYLAYTGMCVEFQPKILTDFQDVLRGDRNATERFVASFSNIARHIGHSIIDEKMKFQKSREIDNYRQELMGKKINGYSDVGSEYGNECCKLGFSAIEEKYVKYLNDFDSAHKVTFNLAKELLYWR